MHPTFLDNMSWEMAEVYGAITDQIMINLARHFPFFEYVDDVPTSAFTYQASMLAQMGQVSKETVQIIRNGLEDADLALQGVLEQAIIDAVKSSEPELLEAVKKGVLTPATLPAVVAPSQMRAFQLYYQQAADKLNLVNTVMLESTQSAYQQMVSDVVSELSLADRMYRTQVAIDTAAGETITGVSSWNQALKHATDRLREGGITGFIDHAGRQWSAEAYVAMDIRTTVFNTGRAATWEVNQDFGNDLYLVSYHNGARPLCYPWQNKVISATDNVRTVVDLDGNEVQVYAQSETSYGEPAGLFGINCKHYPTPFIPGVSLADGKPQDKAENDKVYAESQEQRRLERKIREEKRDLQMLKAQGAPEEEIAKQREKVKQSSADIDDFCRETGRARHRDREAVYTKREFPDADRYDVSQFKKDQQKIINDYYRKGGEQKGFTSEQFSPDDMQNNRNFFTRKEKQESENKTNQTQEGFAISKTKEEAEEFAKTFCDLNAFGSTGISYDGVSLDTANIVNKHLTDFVNEYDVEKFGGVVAPAKNSKLGKYMEGKNAAFNRVSRSVLLNRETLKTPEIIANRLAEEKNLVKDYLKNPSLYPNLDSTTKRILDASAKTGRASVADNLGDVINHECGHALEKLLKSAKNYDRIYLDWEKHARDISGYATTELGEFIAESYCAWKKGEKIWKEMTKAFLEIRK